MNPQIPKEQLVELRELFRQKFEEEDFCIGQEQVEKLFRELLGESEPDKSIHLGLPEGLTESIDIISVELDRIIPKLKDIFDQDNLFFRHIRNKR